MQGELKSTIESIATIDKNMRTTAQSSKCYKCEGNYIAKLCPFLYKECYSCKNKGDIGKVCRKKHKSMQPDSSNIIPFEMLLLKRF